MSLPPAPLITLDYAAMRATIAPAAGGAIASFSETRDGARIDWLRAASTRAIEAGDPLGMASFPLLPFCNRIRNGRFDFEGKRVALAPNYQDSPHTLHGIGWQRAWDAEHTVNTARLRYTHRPDAWPFAFEAEQLITLDQHGLSVALSVTNSGDRPMPLGLGHHPYYPHHAGTTITADTRAIWTGDAETMPTGLDIDHPVLPSLRRGMAVRDFDLDNNFTGWDRRAAIRWPSGASLLLWAEAPLDYFVLYTPADQDFFCAEPVSNCTDWLNLRAHCPSAQIGGSILAPGQTLRTRLGWTPSWPHPLSSA